MAFNRNKALSKAQKLLQKGKVADAIREYEEIVAADPSDVRMLLKIGDLHAKVGNVEAACDTYHKVGEHYAKDGFFLKAVAVFKQILKLDPGLIAVYLRLAELYQQLGLNSEAMKQYQVVVRHYETQGLKKESLDILRKMAELNPENTASKLKLAELYAREGHASSAIEQLRSVAEDLRAKENFEELTRVYEKMEGLEGADRRAVRLELSEVYLQVGDPQKALSKLEVLFEENPKDSPTLDLLARAFTDLNQTEKARSVLTQLLAVLDSEGRSAEKDQVTGRIRRLSLQESSLPPIDGVPQVEAPALPEVTAPLPIAVSSWEASPAPQADPATAKVLAEVDVFLNYGLIDKACETLSLLVTRAPASAAAREKLAQAFRQKGDVAGLILALTAARDAASAAGRSDTESVISEEILRYGTSSAAYAPAAQGVSDESAELEIVDDEAPIDVDEAAESISHVADEPSVESLDREFERGEVSEGEGFPAEAGSEALEEAVEPALAVEESVPSLDFSGEIEFEIPIELSAMPEEAPAPDASMPEPPAEVPADIPETMEANGEETVVSSLPSVSDAFVSEDEYEEGQAGEEEAGAEGEESGRPEVHARDEEEDEDGFEDEDREDPGQAYQASPSEGEAEEDVDEDESLIDMEEAEFFIKEGLLDEAIGVYESILAARPGYLPAEDKLAELRSVKPKPSAVRVDTGSAERRKESRPASVLPMEPPSEPRSASTQRVLAEKRIARSSEGFFDLSTELQDEISELEQTLSQPKTDEEEEYLSPEEVISEFKKGVARTVRRDDHQTHYNLGIAYKEMGLLDEAIHEFEVASDNVSMAVDCASMIGLCLMGKREYLVAVKVYRRALASVKPTSVEAFGLSYELAEAYIGHGKLHEAYKLFARIRDVDPSFRDVRRRAKELEADLGSSAPPPSAPERPESEESDGEKGKAAVEIPGKKNKISYI